MYKNFMIYVDACDNGVDKVFEKQFMHVPSTLWSRVNKMNPMWWDEKSNENELFKKAIEIANEELYSEVRGCLL